MINYYIIDNIFILLTKSHIQITTNYQDIVKRLRWGFN